jgi:hypothetical protein
MPLPTYVSTVVSVFAAAGVQIPGLGGKNDFDVARKHCEKWEGDLNEILKNFVLDHNNIPTKVCTTIAFERPGNGPIILPTAGA